MTPYSVLVIKHGALGDIVLATAGFAAIRARHPSAHIVCLTTKPYVDLLVQSPYFNEIWVDSKPGLLQYKAITRLRSMLRSQPWKWIYDLQTSERTTRYQWLLARPWPNISNASRWSSHPRGAYDTGRHALENMKSQLMLAGITSIGAPDLGWLTEDISGFALPESYALLVPGGAAHRPEKRWPAEQYAILAQELVDKKITPVLIGTTAEALAIESIAARVPRAINLCGKTSIAQLAPLARGASLAVGNDTGPMHVIAASGCPSTVLFSHASSPIRSAPIGPQVSIIQVRDLRELAVDRVLASLTGRA